MSEHSDIFIRLTLDVPGAGSVIHTAQLRPLDARTCQLIRIIELAPDGTIHGGATPTTSAGLQTDPQRIVPHPDLYGDFPDVTAEVLSEKEFDTLWQQTITQFPTLK